MLKIILVKTELAEMSHKIPNGFNENEVSFVPKNSKLSFLKNFSTI